MKELIYINKGWSSQVLNTNVTLEYEQYDSTGKLLTTKAKQTLFSPNDYGPQGVPAINNNYFTQTERYQKYAEAKIAAYKRRATPQGRVDDDAVKYKNWERMHSLPTMWFDTAGCVQGHWSSDANLGMIKTTSSFAGSVDKGTYKTPAERKA